MKLRVISCLIALLLVGLMLLAITQRSSSSQDHTVMNHNALAQSNEDPTGTIDGAKNPELISDYKAYEVFFHSVAVADYATESQKLDAQDKFRNAQLSDEDTAKLFKILGGFYQTRLTIASQADEFSKTGTKNMGDELAKLNEQMTSVVSSSQQAIQSQLSSEGAAKLHQHILGLKKKIKILPGPSN
jgi:hypothetical protein